METQKRSSSGARMKPPRLLKLVIPTAGVLLAFISLFTLNQCSTRGPSLFSRRSISELDRKAQPHFDLAKQNIPKVARKLSTVSAISRMCWYMSTDKAALQKFLTGQLHPVISPCARGAKVYGVDMDAAVFHELTAAVGKDNARSAAFAAAGLGMEAVFAKSLIRSLMRGLGSVAARLGASWGGAAGLAVADGPLPFGDVVGVVMGVGGTIWSAYDLWQCQDRLPAEITAVLNAAVDHVHEQCRKQVQ